MNAIRWVGVLAMQGRPADGRMILLGALTWPASADGELAARLPLMHRTDPADAESAEPAGCIDTLRFDGEALTASGRYWGPRLGSGLLVQVPVALQVLIQAEATHNGLVSLAQGQVMGATLLPLDTSPLWPEATITLHYERKP